MRRLLPPLLYLGLAAALFHGAWAAPGSTTVGGHGDADATMWYFAWVPHAVAHGANPLLTDHLAYPGGANLAWQTSQPLAGLLSWPVATLFGPYAAYDVVLTLALALSAWCAYLVIRRWVPSGPAAFAGGLLYGFSPYMVAHALGHANLVTALVPPLMLAALDEILVRRRRPPLQAGVVLGLLATVQFFLAEELLATEAIMAVVAVVVLVVADRRQAQLAWRHVARALGTALLVALVLCSWALLTQFRGPQRLGGVFQHPGGFSSDLLNFVVPTGVQQVSPSFARSVAERFTGNRAEQTAYLGLPLLLILAITVWRLRHVLWVRVVAALGAVAALLSMGPTLHIAGHATHIPLPWVIFEHLPLTANLVPGRLSLYAFLAAALLLAAFVEHTLRQRGAQLYAGAALLALAVVALLPLLNFPSAGHNDPRFFLAGGDVSRIPEGASVLVAPFVARGDDVDPQMWQVRADLRFRMPGGYVLLPDPQHRDTHLIGPRPRPLSDAMIAIFDGSPAPRLDDNSRAVMRGDLRSWQTRAVIVGPMPHRATMVAFLTDLLGTAPQEDQGVEVWWSVAATQPGGGQPSALRAATAPMSPS